MSDSDRGKLPPIGTLIVGLIAFTITFLLWTTTSNLDRQNQIAAEQRSEQYADETQKQIGRDCADLPASELDVCSQSAIAGQREAERNQGDLEAQRTMAVWTRAMGQVAIIGMGIGIFSLWLIFTTFRETRNAAESARETQRSFIQAERARIVAVPTAQGWLASDKSLTLTLLVANFGRTSAQVREIHLWTAGFDIMRSAPATAIHPIESVYKVDMEVKVPIKIDEFPSDSEITGFVLYDSAFGKGHRTHFGFSVARFEPHPQVITTSNITVREIARSEGWPEDT